MLVFAAFAAAAALVLYVLVIYPVLLDLLARMRRWPVRRRRFTPQVSVIIAVHNGEQHLERKLDSIAALHYPREKLEILIASDGSTDRTEEIAACYPDSRITLLRLARKGKPAALNAAVSRARGEILVFTDVRQELAPDSLNYLLENLADPNIGVVSAELVMHSGDTREEVSVGLYWRYEFWIRMRLSQLDSIFGASGAYYAMRRELAAPIPEDSLLDDMHLPLAAFFRGYRLVVDARAHMYDSPANLRVEFWRKVRTNAGNYQVLYHYPQLLSPRNRLWFHYVSYKLSRLLLPFALLTIAVCTPLLASPWREIALTGQLLVYGLAALDPLVPDWAPGKRISSVLRTFVVLMAATLCAVGIFFLPSSRFWVPTSLPPRGEKGPSVDSAAPAKVPLNTSD